MDMHRRVRLRHRHPLGYRIVVQVQQPHHDGIDRRPGRWQGRRGSRLRSRRRLRCLPDILRGPSLPARAREQARRHRALVEEPIRFHSALHPVIRLPPS